MWLEWRKALALIDGLKMKEEFRLSLLWLTLERKVVPSLIAAFVVKVLFGSGILSFFMGDTLSSISSVSFREDASSILSLPWSSVIIVFYFPFKDDSLGKFDACLKVGSLIR